jgi:hypothetical protein
VVRPLLSLLLVPMMCVISPATCLIPLVCEPPKACKLYNQNRIGLQPGYIRCTYICKLGSGGSGFVSRIQKGDSCVAETDWVEGGWGD